MMNVRTLTWEDFLSLKPTTNREGKICKFRFGAMDMQAVNSVYQKTPLRVWTVLDVDGKLTIASGVHIVNRAYYLITEQSAPYIHVEIPVPYYLIIAQRKVGEVIYINYQTLNYDDLADEVELWYMEEHDLTASQMDSFSIIGMFVGKPSLISWEG